MSACEKCWADAFRRQSEDTSKSQAEHYSDLLREREDTPCTPKEAAGQWWNEMRGRDERDYYLLTAEEKVKPQP